MHGEDGNDTTMPGDELYCYPGGDVLKNKLNITEAELLEYAERRLTAIRLDELLMRRMRGNFDFAHLKAIHFFIFQDLYTWAGQQRKINIAKGVLFCEAMFIDDMAKEIFTGLKKENHLAGLNRADFVKRMAFYFGEINALHPFREGNGRTQREFFRELAKANRYKLSFVGVTEEEMIQASADSFVRDYRGLEAIVDKGLTR